MRTCRFSIGRCNRIRKFIYGFQADLSYSDITSVSASVLHLIRARSHRGSSYTNCHQHYILRYNVSGASTTRSQPIS
ncbi:uncharacterized protein LOC125499929 isoform X2 [Athalia rosae]|uniref:uncharacterized protein LOC125499929 isoform X2 n=1 Tax=Athalia rosae TaxID=37344 RepID=UPI0020338F30|nr:uncharacterized protein LOC125499929 isoform X2 [Athalia rosae]